MKVLRRHEERKPEGGQSSRGDGQLRRL